MESLIQVNPETNDEARRPGPKPTHDEVRAKLIGTALEMMLQEGVTPSLKDLSFSDVVDRSGVARATAYRSLGEGADVSPSEWIRQELLRATIRAAPGGDEYQGTAAAALKVLKHSSEILDHGNTRQLTDLMRETIRVGCEANYEALHNSVFWRASIAMECSIASQGDNADPELLEELQKSESGSIGDFAALYEALGSEFNLRIKAPYSWRQVAAASASLVEGIAMRNRFSKDVGLTMRRTGPGGTEVPWTLLGIGFEALVLAMTEPVPGKPWANLALPDFDEDDT